VFLRGLRDVVMTDRSALWVAVRRPLTFLFVCGCVVSMWASGRLSVRLIADGMVSFAFLPLFQLLAFATVFRRAPRRLRFADAADRFFAGNTPWLWWLVAFAALRCLLTPLQAGAPPQLLVDFVKATLVGVLAWSAYVDYRFFREVLLAPDSARDVILQRAIAWTSGAVYFFGIAVWPVIVGRIVP
jgi:hypothetical protein